MPRSRRHNHSTVRLIVFLVLLSLTSLFVGSVMLHDPIPQAQDSLVRITDTRGEVCTGFLVSPDLVLTVSHCVDASAMLAVDGYPGTTVRVDPYYDLAAVKYLPAVWRPELRFSDIPVRRGEALVGIGYALGQTQLLVRPVHAALPHASISPNNPPGLYVQPQWAHGMSGGPVLNAAGRVVSIIQEAPQDEGLGWGVEVPIIRAFLVGLVEED